MTTPRPLQCDTPRDSINAGTEPLFDELQFAASPFTNSASESDSAPVSKEVKPKRKPRSPKSAAHQAEYHKRWRKTPEGRASMVAAYKRWCEKHPGRAATTWRREA